MALAIGELGKATDTKVETIRYYERIGLLPPNSRRQQNGACTPVPMDELRTDPPVAYHVAGFPLTR